MPEENTGMMALSHTVNLGRDGYEIHVMVAKNSAAPQKYTLSFIRNDSDQSNFTLEFAALHVMNSFIKDITDVYEQVRKIHL